MDERLRRLRRRRDALGSLADGARYYVDLLRAGELTLVDLELASACGDAAAEAAVRSLGDAAPAVLSPALRDAVARTRTMIDEQVQGPVALMLLGRIFSAPPNGATLVLESLGQAPDRVVSEVARVLGDGLRVDSPSPPPLEQLRELLETARSEWQSLDARPGRPLAAGTEHVLLAVLLRDHERDGVLSSLGLSYWDCREELIDAYARAAESGVDPDVGPRS